MSFDIKNFSLGFLDEENLLMLYKQNNIIHISAILIYIYIFRVLQILVAAFLTSTSLLLSK